MRKLFWIPLLLFCMPGRAQTGPMKISGSILDKTTGKPLVNATISHSGSGSRTLSDSLGNFMLNLTSGTGTVTFSYTGYQSQTMAVNPQPMLISLLPLASTLKEVVVSTGYQDLPAERSSGSFDKINEKLVQRTISTSIVDRLEGMLSSVYINRNTSNPQISIRGLSSLSAGIISPLIVVDNFPFEGDISSINPNDVESVTVLKDAAASSIWGARAGNGVIVITTKKGSSDGKLNISLVSNLSMQEAPDLEGLNWMGSESFLEMEDFLFQRNFYNNQFTNTTSRPVISPYVEDLQKRRLGLMTADELAARRALYAGRDFIKDAGESLYQLGVRQQYHLQLTGGSSNMQYLVSGGYDQNTRNETGNAYGRTTLMTRITLKPDRKTEIGFSGNLSYNTNTNNSIGGIENLAPGGGRSRYYPYARLTDENGVPQALERDFRKAYQDTTGGGQLLSWQFIPLQERDLVHNESTNRDTWLQMTVKRTLLKGLSAEAMYQYQGGQAERGRLLEASSYYARNLVNLYSQRTANGINRMLPAGGIMENSYANMSAHSGRLLLQYDQSWENWKLDAMGGTEIRRNLQTSNQFTRYGYNPDVLSAAAVDHLTIFPQWGNLRSPQAITNGQSESGTDLRFTSIFANAGLSYKSRYLVNASARKDASNILGVSTNQRGVPLASVGVGWQLHRENWFSIKALDLLKLRITYGSSGNLNPSLSALSTIAYLPANINIFNIPYANVRNPPNPSLRWEKVKTVNVGMDFGLTKGWLRGSVEWYRKNAVDLLSNYPLDPTTGLNSFTINAAQMHTQGWDINLHSTVGKKAVVWSSQLLFSYVKSNIDELVRTSNSVTGFPGYGSGLVTQKDFQPYAIFSYRWAGLDPQTGDPQGYVDKEISKDYRRLVSPVSVDELVYHGSTRPNYFAFWRHTISYKAFAVSANIGGEFGHYFRTPTIHYGTLFNNWLTHSDFDVRWQQPGDEQRTTVPSMVYPANTNRERFYEFSEVNVESASHIRLQDIRLEYNPVLRKANRNISLYIMGQNLGFIWLANSRGLDPSNPNGLMPQKTFSIGTQIKL